MPEEVVNRMDLKFQQLLMRVTDWISVRTSRKDNSDES